jgi:hypothetical protein
MRCGRQLDVGKRVLREKVIPLTSSSRASFLETGREYFFWQ